MRSPTFCCSLSYNYVLSVSFRILGHIGRGGIFEAPDGFRSEVGVGQKQRQPGTYSQTGDHLHNCFLLRRIIFLNVINSTKS